MHYDALKLTCIQGLEDIVFREMTAYPALQIISRGLGEVYIQPIQNLKSLLSLRSIQNIYIIQRGSELNPHFISKHKSILGNLIEIVLKENTTRMTTCTLSCAGTQSKEVLSIQKFIESTYKLGAAENADLEIYIGKKDSLWELGVRLTARPLSVRDYKVEHIPGGLNPTIAYAMNTFCDLKNKKSYLNICSGSGTLIIEAAISNPTLKLVGFDIDGKTNALAVQNIKKAGFVKKIHLNTASIFDVPDFGKFDIITSDLPFGMQISKGEDLERLYTSFVAYCEETVSPTGILVVYTSAYELLENILENSTFKIDQTINLKLSTVVGAYLYPKIIVCTCKAK